MNNHTKKMVAPVVVVLVLVVYYIVIGITVLKLDIPLMAKVLVIAIPLLTCALLVVVLVERIKEIRSGKEDDLGKY